MGATVGAPVTVVTAMEAVDGCRGGHFAFASASLADGDAAEVETGRPGHRAGALGAIWCTYGVRGVKPPKRLRERQTVTADVRTVRDVSASGRDLAVRTIGRDSARGTAVRNRREMPSVHLTSLATGAWCCLGGVAAQFGSAGRQFPFL